MRRTAISVWMAITVTIAACGPGASGPAATATPDAAARATLAAATAPALPIASPTAAVPSPAPVSTAPASPPSVPAPATPAPTAASIAAPGPPVPSLATAAPSPPASPVAASPAGPTLGATYRGTHSQGGSFLLVADAARSEVRGYAIDWQSGACNGISLRSGIVPGQPFVVGSPPPQSLRIAVQEDTFAHETPGGMRLMGRFTSPTEAEGTLTLPAPMPCAGTITWRVRTE